MQTAGQAIRPAFRGRALLDTGASCTGIDSSIVQALGFMRTGTTSIHTPSTGTTPHVCNQYDISLIVLMAPQFHIASLVIPVVESQLSNQGFHVLIGRDVLANALLVYNGKSGTASIGF